MQTLDVFCVFLDLMEKHILSIKKGLFSLCKEKKVMSSQCL